VLEMAEKHHCSKNTPGGGEKSQDSHACCYAASVKWLPWDFSPPPGVGLLYGFFEFSAI
jgi:hypothetical protein